MPAPETVLDDVRVVLSDTRKTPAEKLKSIQVYVSEPDFLEELRDVDPAKFDEMKDAFTKAVGILISDFVMRPRAIKIVMRYLKESGFNV